MKFLTIDDIKKHTRVDIEADDELLSLYGAAAEDTVLNMCETTIEELFADHGCIPPAIYQAALMLTDHSYQQRSPASIQQLYAVPYTIDALIKPYMIL